VVDLVLPEIKENGPGLPIEFQGQGPRCSRIWSNIMAEEEETEMFPRG